MKSIKTALIYGFLVWLIPFLLALFLFSVRQSNRPLFDSFMSVVLAAGVIFFAIKYFQKVEENFFKEGIYIGVIWLVASLALDFPMFSAGPMKMSLTDYISDIGITYIMIPVIATGIGYILEDRKKTADRAAKI